MTIDEFKQAIGETSGQVPDISRERLDFEKEKFDFRKKEHHRFNGCFMVFVLLNFAILILLFAVLILEY